MKQNHSRKNMSSFLLFFTPGALIASKAESDGDAAKSYDHDVLYVSSKLNLIDEL